MKIQTIISVLVTVLVGLLMVPLPDNWWWAYYFCGASLALFVFREEIFGVEW